MNVKKSTIIFLLILILIVVAIASCFGKKNLGPGKYEVTQAVYEVKDNDYELDVKGYGEYDVKKLNIVTNPTQDKMTLEIKSDKSHTLYVKSDKDIVQEQGSTSFKKKKKKR